MLPGVLIVSFKNVYVPNQQVVNSAENDALGGDLLNNETYKDNFVTLSVGFILERGCKEQSSLPGCSSVYSHFQKTTQLAESKRKIMFIIDNHDVK